MSVSTHPLEFGIAQPADRNLTNRQRVRPPVWEGRGKVRGVVNVMDDRVREQALGDGSGDLAMPKGLAADRDGVLYVADGIFDNVQLFDRAGEFLLTLGRRGTGPGEFWLPSGVFVSPEGELYVADTYNRRVQVFRLQEGYVASGS